MINLLIKLITAPLILIIASFIFNDVNYPNFSYPIIVGVTLAITAYVLDFIFVRRKLLWMSVVSDFILAILIIYYVSNMFGYTTSFAGSLVTGGLFAIVEYFIHRYLIKHRRVKKAPGIT